MVHHSAGSDDQNPLRTEGIGESEAVREPGIQKGLSELAPSTITPAQLLVDLAHHLESAYQELCAFSTLRFQKSALAAYRIARDFPDQSQPLVGEAYLVAADAVIFRARQQGVYKNESNADALALLSSAEQVLLKKAWDEPTAELRLMLLRHQATHITFPSYNAGNLDEMEEINWLLEEKPASALAVNQIASLAFREAHLKYGDGIDTYAYPLLENCLAFAGQNKETAKTCIVGIYALLGMTLATAYLNSEISATPQATESALIEGIGYLQRAARFAERFLPKDSLLHPIIYAHLLSLHGQRADPFLEDMADAYDMLREWMIEATKAIPDSILMVSVESAKAYLERKFPFKEEDTDPNDVAFIYRGYINELAPFLERAFELSSKSSGARMMTEFTEGLVLATMGVLITDHQPRRVLELFGPYLPEKGALLSSSQRSFLGFYAQALTGTGQYHEATEVAERVLKNLELVDPRRIRAVTLMVAHVEFALEMTATDPDWAAKRILDVLPHFGSLPSDRVEDAYLCAAEICHIAGKGEIAEEWLALYDQYRGYVLVSSDAEESSFPTLREDSEQERDQEQEVEAAVISNRELILRAMISFAKAELPIDHLEGIVAYLREQRERPRFRMEMDAPQASQFFAIDARLALIKQEVDLAQELFEQAIGCLNPAVAGHQFALALHYQGLSIAHLQKSDSLESERCLLKAVEFFETLASPSIYQVATYTQLEAIYRERGEQERARHYALKRGAALDAVTAIPDIPAEIVPAKIHRDE